MTMACNCGLVCRATDPECEGTQLSRGGGGGGGGGGKKDPGDGYSIVADGDGPGFPIYSANPAPPLDSVSKGRHR
jgi:hypothetical protein